MRRALSSYLLSPTLWGGAYMLTFGLLLQINKEAATFAAPFFWGYHIAIVAFAASVALKMSLPPSRISKVLGAIIWVHLFALFAGVLFYLPWFLPTYDTETRFGWDPENARLIQVLLNLAVIIGGTILVTCAICLILKK